MLNLLYRSGLFLVTFTLLTVSIFCEETKTVAGLRENPPEVHAFINAPYYHCSQRGNHLRNPGYPGRLDRGGWREYAPPRGCADMGCFRADHLSRFD